ncbi:type 1 glutamine amidotransferase [Aspergillus novofumigatus IBT 16806]|uniref:Class I glutamine amidotransferase-like protein n=1 Tax=Aspergillus novofumigatus (strain IBT 16806) TaxID=1392255 RepID=A0A2I1CLF6_ASPN1|nr:class I glutamine amidotransferase-like protein [Aspergillus novofumigatus IBT 16806]PKX98453.1 class I glutamine amidotransferase-like protein [Aspergillus novofumigatus IBT 16806]
MHLHIAILDLDVPVPTVYAARGLYSSQLTNLLISAAARLSQSQALPPGKEITLSTSSYDVIGGIFPPAHLLRERGGSGIDGILLTGSSTSAYRSDQHPWIPSLQTFLADVYVSHPHIKFFGSCFGHQMLARTLVPGCEVEACPAGYEIGVHAISLKEEFVERIGLPFLPPAAAGEGKKEMKLQFIHGDWVVCETGLPDDWVNVGSTPRCPIQGLYRPGRVLTFQGHFEFDVFVNSETCLEFGRRWERYVRAIEARDGEDDAEVAAEMVVWFFAGEDMRAAEVKMMEGGLLTPPLE